MKKNSTISLNLIAALLILLQAFVPAALRADDSNTASVKIPYWKVSKPLLYQKGNTQVTAETTGEHKALTHEFTNRRALTGRSCTVNDIFSTVDVASLPKNLANITDADVTNHAAFMNAVTATTGYNPITSVRDMARHYAAGTTGGFCIGQESGNNVLTIDLIKKFTIEFYCEGEMVDKHYAGVSSSLNGVKLSLISLPGSKNSCVNIQATSSREFDEIRLINTGVEISALSALDVKYAFVGTAQIYSVTRDPSGSEVKNDTIRNFSDYCSDYGLTGGKVTGIGVNSDKIINPDLGDGGALTQAVVTLLSTVPKGAQTTVSSGETFAKGTSLGFRTHGYSAAELNVVGGGMLVKLLDHSGKTIKTYTMDHSVLGLNVVSGGDRDITVEADTAFSGATLQYIGVLGVNAGIKSLDYIYVTPAPEVISNPEIDPSASFNICDDQTSAQLYHNNSVPVTWSYVKESSYPGDNDDVKIDQDGNVTGMNGAAGAYYVFRATAQDGTYEDVTITKNVGADSQSSCRNKISADQGFALAESMPDVTASLLSMSKFKDNDNLLDGKEDTYAKYIPGAELLGKVGVVAIKTKEKGKTFRGLLNIASTDSVKAGFVIQDKGEGLNLNLLNEYSLRFYLNGKNVYHESLKGATVLDVALAGSNKIQKLEMAAVVPAGIDFDEIGLYHAGVLGVNLSEIDFFYPFYETGTDIAKCDDPLSCSPTMISSSIDNTASALTVSKGASIDDDLTGTLGTVNIGTGISNISYILDNDLSTALTLGSVAKVAGGYRIAVKLGRKADYRQQLAIIMDDNNYESKVSGLSSDVLNALGISAGHWMKVETYLNGKATGETKTDWKVLGADVLTTQGHNIYVWNPQKKYDEIVITIAGVADVAKLQKIYGIVLQSDIDGDGVPDCKDQDSCNGDISNTNSPHVCLGSDIKFTFTGKKGFTYKIIAADQTVSGGDSPTLYTATAVKDTLEGEENFECTVKSIASGRFAARVMQEKASADGGYQQDGEINYTVHPTLTHWNPLTTNTDWNTWSNWIEGSPYACTDVVIPSNAKAYPVLRHFDATDASHNSCNGIHFEPGAAVENVFRLSYDSAWVDLSLANEQAAVYMAPLAAVHSGDFYPSTVSSADYFLPLTDKNDPATFEHRTSPSVYQRIWKGSVKEDFGGTNYSDVSLISKATWSHAFNGLTQDYSSASKSGKSDNSLNAPYCFSLMAENNNAAASGNFIIHLPKAGKRTYSYYNAISGNAEGSETVDHTTDGSKLWSTVNWKNAETEGLRLNYSASSSAKGDGIFLVGNPLMSHLNVAKFLEGNSGKVSGIKLCSNNTSTSVIDVNGTLISSSSTLTDDEKYIAPSAAFFVQAAGTTTDDVTTYPSTLQILYDTTMYAGVAASAPAQSRAKAGFGSADSAVGCLHITAADGTHTSGAVLLSGSNATAATLIDEEYKPALAAFVVRNGKAMDICPADADVIPLGYVLSRPDTVTVSFSRSGSFDTDGWRLYDSETGRDYSLSESPEIYMSGSNSGRLYLSRIGEVTRISNAKASMSGVSVSAERTQVTVRSTRENIAKVSIYTSDGTLISERTALRAPEVTLQAVSGVILVKVTLTDSKEQTFKLLAE